MEWDDLFINMAYLVAMKSKDNSTHIGAVVVGPDNEVRSVGFNSFPRKINDNVKERHERPEKYFWMAHAERNSIYNAARMGLSLKGCKIYTNGIPCSDCAIAAVQAGITEVIYDKSWDAPDKWNESCLKGKQILEEASIKITEWSGDLLQIHRLQRGEIK